MQPIPDKSARTAERLHGRKALVTGSETGIGHEIALEFARQGADIAVHMLYEPEAAAQLVDGIRALGRRAEAFRADFRDVADAENLARAAAGFLGGLDVLVNNAGITFNRPFEQVTVEQFDTLYAVNVRGPYFLTQAALPALIEARGSIINVSSIHALEGFPGHSVYAGTKGAISAQSRELAVELSLEGVRVNTIVPGSIVVPNYYKATPGYDPSGGARLIPAGFVGEPRDIAAAAVFLASDDARYIVGQSLVVDGGTTAWMPFSDAFRQQGTSQFGKGYVPGI